MPISGVRGWIEAAWRKAGRHHRVAGWSWSDRRVYSIFVLSGLESAILSSGSKSRRPSEITDGLSVTIVAGEAAGDYQPWGYPVHWRDPALGINQSPHGFGGPYPGGANFLFADGAVKFLRNKTPLPVFRALATPDGHERVDLDKLD